MQKKKWVRVGLATVIVGGAFGGMSAAFLLFGFSYLYGVTGSTNLHKILLSAFYASASGGAPLLYVALVLIARSSAQSLANEIAYSTRSG